ncbi:YjiH family protein [Auritidibacter ignavus]|uniref:YjiH family protein n=1 Tax=Auritidibacter ignavus TaxID=678932 RepID=UPI00244C35A0|nr:YjiH family protein [Auritidibacter ignavus]WGH90130.1 YjiH family protein [Auritidibacter ignavus]
MSEMSTSTPHPDETAQPTRPRASSTWWFLLPSLVGVLIFMVPVPDGAGSVTIPIAFLSDSLTTALGVLVPWIVVALVAISVIGTLVWWTARPAFLDNHLGRTLFDIGWMWMTVRVLGLVFAVLIVLQLGPEQVWGENTGMVIMDLATVLVSVFFLAGLLLPLLLNFGLLDFVGALMTRLMRPLFRLPGRSSVVCLSSWLGDGSIGVLMANQQYVQGYYTKREAAVLGTTFNIVSVTFTVVILEYLGLQHMFLPFYLTIVVAGLVAGVVMVRIPPLSRISDDYAEGVTPQPEETAPPRRGLLRRAWNSGLKRGCEVHLGSVVRHGFSNVLEMWVVVVPSILAIGTASVMLAEHTPLFTWLGAPFIPVLDLMQVPQAEEASATMLIGFADMLLPAAFAASIDAEMTRFIIGALSVTQLIFMSEVGGMLLASRIPVRFHHLVAIFLLRTLITLPVIVAIAHLFY